MMPTSPNRRGMTLPLLALSCLCSACDRKGSDPQPVMTAPAPATTTSEPAPTSSAAVPPSADQPNDAAASERAPTTIVTTGPVITLEQFKALEREKWEEVTYSRAVEAFGWKGIKTDRFDAAGIILETFEWPNPDGSKVEAVFRDNLLYRLNQTDLKTTEQLIAEASPDKESSPADSQTAPAPEPAPATATEPVITLEKFQSLENKMPYTRVAEIFGRHGTKANQIEWPGGRTMYDVRWENPDGGMVTANFQDDELHIRNHTGLKPADQLATDPPGAADPSDESSPQPTDTGAAPQ